MNSIVILEKLLEDVLTMPSVQEIHVRTNEEFDEVMDDIIAGLVMSGCMKKDVHAQHFLSAMDPSVQVYVCGQHKYTVIKVMA